MSSFLPLLLAYLLGGITFIPLLLALVLLHAALVLPTRHDPNQSTHDGREHHEEHSGSASTVVKSLPDELKPRPHVPDVAAGYFAVCREYVPGGINGKPPERTTPAGAVVALESPSVYQAMYRSIFDRSKSMTPSLEAGSGKGKKGRNVFYVVMRHGHLMLYDDSEQLEVRHVISLAHYHVDIFAGGDTIPEGELWIKRNCIRLIQRAERESSDSKPFYLFSDNCSEKEDFYHAMLQSQEQRTDRLQSPPLPLKFDTSDLVRLVQQLHASEENLHTRWINALIGRLFLSLYKTPEIENFIRKKITSKIARVPKPALISSIHLQKVDMGNLPPFVTNPKLKELTVDGELTVEADVSYKGNFRLEICAIARIDLGPRIKAREVTLVLASILKRLEGHILVRIKPPPSNRLWTTFETPPHMEFLLEPIVSTRQITYGVILRAIENRIREVVNETLVLPNWDDMPFSDTISQEYRGGIWETISKTHGIPQSLGADTGHESSGAVADSDIDQSKFSAANTTASVATRSMPNLEETSTLIPHKLTDSNAVIDDREGMAFASATDFKSQLKPKAMRSGSFATFADTTTDMKSANASVILAEESHAHDAAATMKTIPHSPARSPLGSPSRLSAVHHHEPRQSTSTHSHPKTSNHPIDTASSTAIDLPSEPELPHDISRNSPRVKPTNDSSSSLSSLERRPTLNQSLTSATAAAKKWLTSRQAGSATPMHDMPSSMATSAPSKDIDEDTSASSIRSTSIISSHSKGEAPPQLGSPSHPIGRGQPLPPVGTPLPPPPKPEKQKTWGVPTASAFASLARRRPLPPQGPSQINTDAKISADVKPSKTSSTQLVHDIDNAAGRRIHRRMSSSAHSTSNSIPPSLPKRRQRHSVTERPGRNDGGNEESLLVVEAPPVDLSAPASPLDEAQHHLEMDSDAAQGLDEQSQNMRLDC